MTAAQPTLDAALAADALRHGEHLTREQWAGLFERAPWTLPHDTSFNRKGDVLNGWRCPDCGDVESNAYMLMINHGWNPNVVGWGSSSGECTRQMLRRAHAAFDRRAEAAAAMCAAAGHTHRPGRRHVNPGACDECWNATREEDDRG